MPIFEDSYALLWWGPRRGGKSASMAQQCGIDLINGRKVFADSPVSFDYQPLPGSKLYHYQTLPLNYDEFLLIDSPEFKQKYMHSIAAWDEVDKWLFARNFQSVFNKICSQFITLIGKLEMTFYFTAQFLSLVEKNIRIQLDSQIRCIDLSFKYPHLQRGSTIGQVWQDISGRFTGDMFEYTQESYQQTFYAKPFWGIYDTKHAPPLLEAQRKLEIKQPKKIISIGDIDGAIDQDSQYRLDNKENNGLILEHLATELGALKEVGAQTEFTKQEINIMARQRGFNDSDYSLFSQLYRWNIVPVGRGKYGLIA